MIQQSFDGEKISVNEYRRPKKSVSVVLYSNQQTFQSQPNYMRSNSLEINTFVPKPFPKKNSIQVTPFKLYNKYGVNVELEVPEISINNNSFDDINISVDSDYSDNNEDDNNSLSEVSFELCDESIEGPKTINELRSEMKRDKIIFGYNNIRIFNEFEKIYKQSIFLNRYNNEDCSINYIKPTMFKKYFMFNEDKKVQRFSEGGRRSSYSGRSTRNSFSQRCSNFSLLDILESAANDIKDRKTIEIMKGN